jgi:hypothetical protein
VDSMWSLRVRVTVRLRLYYNRQNLGPGEFPGDYHWGLVGDGQAFTQIE